MADALTRNNLKLINKKITNAELEIGRIVQEKKCEKLSQDNKRKVMVSTHIHTRNN